jgi:Fe-S-cluster containining protein
MIAFDKLAGMAKKKENENRKFFSRLKARIPKDLDVTVHQLHDDVFYEMNCLDCANCCKTLGPRITEKDIERIAKFLKLKKEAFIKTYLRIDEDGDYVFQSMPCPFLLTDNYCSIYDVRPKACAEYPHTDRRKFYQLFNLTLKNIPSCPAVYEIVEKLKVKYP